jgi:UDPglucose 6-dehydrogenase
VIADSRTNIVVVGAGYVGLVTAVGLARHREVQLVERELDKIETLSNNGLPFFEPKLGERIAGLPADNLKFFTDLEDALVPGRRQIVFIAVGTPQTEQADVSEGGETTGHWRPDLGAVDDIVDRLLAHREVSIVMKSTVPPGTGHMILARARNAGNDLEYVSCPEFLREGEALETLDSPDRVVLGYEPVSGQPESWTVKELKGLYRDAYPNLGEPGGPMLIECDLRSAEALKLISNLTLASRIAIANQTANFCEQIGADVRVVMKGVGADARIGKAFLEAGLGWGGSCFDKDIKALHFAASHAGYDFSLAKAVLAVNEDQAARTADKLARRLTDCENPLVAILGLTFKPGTDDLRGSRAFVLARELHRRGLTVRAWDPSPGARGKARANDSRVTVHPEQLTHDQVADSLWDALEGADAVVVATAWDHIVQLDWERAAELMRGQLVVDGRNCLSPDTLEEIGLEYEGTGHHSEGLDRDTLATD